MVAMSDPQYSNPVFKIRYRSNNDLSNKKAPDNIDKPTNDLLDGIEVGDAVTGKSIKDEKKYTGNVVEIKKDDKGENVGISIEDDGIIVDLAPGSVRFAERGDKGNISGKRHEPVDTGNIDYTFGGYDNFQPTTYENKTIKKYSDFK